MTARNKLLALACGIVGLSSPLAAQDPGIETVSWPLKRGPRLAPAAPPLVCPPAVAPACPPAVDPTAPTPPVAPIPPIQPDTNAAPLPSNLTAALTGAEAGGTSARATGLPQVFGDLLGGGFIAGPLPVLVNPDGTFAGQLPVVVNPDGSRELVGGIGRFEPTDENILGRASSPQPGARVIGVLPGKGQVFDPSLADFVARVPQVVRGAFKVTENDTPRPTTRAYFTYNFYDQVSRSIGGFEVPRIVLHQQVFGYEQAFADRQFSVGIRLPYNQLTSPRFVNETSLGDITLTSKAVLLENPRTGNLISAGMLLTVPTGSLPFPSSITGTNIRGVLFQPYLGYIFTGLNGRAFAQGFSSVIIPSEDNDVTFMSNSVNVGYRLFEFETGRLAAIVPVAECHVNTPFDNRGRRSEPVGFVDSVTCLGGTHFLFRSGASIGFAVGTPITGPRPFSLQATLQAGFQF
jgi:hypothetical protein